MKPKLTQNILSSIIFSADERRLPAEVPDAFIWRPEPIETSVPIPGATEAFGPMQPQGVMSYGQVAA